MLVTREDTGATLYEGCWFDGRQTGPAACVFDNDRSVQLFPSVLLCFRSCLLRFFGRADADAGCALTMCVCLHLSRYEGLYLDNKLCMSLDLPQP